MAKRITRKAIVPYSQEQMFDLVNDIERYPEFIAECSHARILTRSDTSLEAELTLGKAGIEQKFSTCNTLDRPNRMTLTLKDGPFSRFDGIWRFREAEGGCEVAFQLIFEFNSFLLNITAGKVIEAIASQQVDLISRRAKAIYN